MSVNSPPLGATQSGGFELRAPALEARTRARLSPDRAARARGNAGDRAAGVDLGGEHRQAPAADAAGGNRRRSGSPVRSAPPASTSGAPGLTITVGADVRRPTWWSSGPRDRLSPVLVLGCIAALNALILLAPAAGLDRHLQLPVLRADGRAVRRQPIPRRPPRDRARSSLPLHRREVVRHAHGLRAGVHRAQLSAGAAVDPRQRVRLQGDRGRLEPRDRGARVERRAPARRRSGQGGGARRPQPADRRLRRSAEATTTS